MRASDVVDIIVDHCGRPTWWERVAKHILARARGEGSGDCLKNGEYWLLKTVASRAPKHQPILVMDVGANVGEWTRLALQAIESPLCIHSFEPSRSTYDHFVTALAQHPRSREVFAHNQGLGIKTEDLVLRVFSEGAGTNSIYQRRIGGAKVNQSTNEIAHVTSGDEFIQTTNIHQVDFLKIDTEGHEIAVLEGVRESLKSGLIKLIQFEYGGSWIDSRHYLWEAFDLLTPYDYNIARLFPTRLKFYHDYNQGEETFCYSNYVALHSSVMEEYGY